LWKGKRSERDWIGAFVKSAQKMEKMDSEEALYWKRKKQLEDEQAEQSREKFVLSSSHRANGTVFAPALH
jgi:hypothetical protein